MEERDDTQALGVLDGLKHIPISRVRASYRPGDKRLILHQDDDYVIIDRQQAALLAPIISIYLKMAGK